MSIPPEFAWILPTVAPFLIGLLVGLIVKRTFKLVMLIVALIVILVAVGYVSLSFTNLYENALHYLPRLIDTGMALGDVLPYSSASFLIGLAIGLWKG